MGASGWANTHVTGRPAASATRRRASPAEVSFEAGGARRPCRKASATFIWSIRGLQTFGLIARRELVEEGIDPTVQDGRQVMEREADAVVGHARLREVVGSDLLRPLTAAHLGPPRF